MRMLSTQVEELEIRLDDQIAYGCRNEVVIYNVPIQEKDGPVHISKLVGEFVGVQINENDVNTAHRMSSTKQPPPFILKFVSRIKRDEVMRNAKFKKPNAESVGGTRDEKIFFSDHLTKRNRELLSKARIFILFGSRIVW